MPKISTKFIFITGGVSSSLGKGLSASTIACLLKEHGFKVSMQKMDPYINIDAGTMSPYQHGEVFVTQDGTETDLDLGNYERFSDIITSKIHSITAGQIYKKVIEKERKGFYLGETVQVIPHITNEIQERIMKVVHYDKPDILIIEIGGTVGDIESIPFLEAIRQFSQKKEHQNIFIHVTLIPTIPLTNEMKTKPSQHSIKQLLSIGIQVDILLCRTQKRLTPLMREKLSIFGNIEEECVIEALDIEKIIYELPILFNQTNLLSIIFKKFNLSSKKKLLDLSKWEKIIYINKNPKKIIHIAIIGKYAEFLDTYKSLYEAIQHGSIDNNSWSNISLIDSDKLSKNVEKKLKSYNGIIIPGGFGIRGFEEKILACQYARINKIPLLGICLGMQAMVIEFARNICNLKNANSIEFDPNTPYPIISLLNNQHSIQTLGSSMRLGLSTIHLDLNTRIYQIYKKRIIQERHRHRYELNTKFHSTLSDHGLKISGFFKEKNENLAESIELSSSWYIGTQFHPEFESKPIKSHPLFTDFISHCIS